jgi:poly(hydroxyalkanoate) depolymerase family esterase
MSEIQKACKGTKQNFGLKALVAAVAVLLSLEVSGVSFAQGLQEVTTFGPNPGNLRMFKFVPDGLSANSPLVIALHGCTQTAADYDSETGWLGIAEKSHFALLLPQQQSANNFNKCFNWFDTGDITRNSGEALSIKQMIDRMKQDHAIDPERVYVTGLSAGGAMTSVMLATYPEIFAGGAVIAGLPYKCATSIIGAFNCMSPGRDGTPATWGTLVRNASSHQGPWPIVSIWHGTADSTVVPMNAQELVDQWTDVHGIDQTIDGQDTVHGHAHKVYKDGNDAVRVETYLVTGMGHGTPISPGTGDEQCGTAAPFILDAGICSSFHIARFWGLTDSAGEPDSHPLRTQLLEQLEDIRTKLDELNRTIEEVNQ